MILQWTTYALLLSQLLKAKVTWFYKDHKELTESYTKHKLILIVLFVMVILQRNIMGILQRNIIIIKKEYILCVRNGVNMVYVDFENMSYWNCGQ